MHQHFSFKSSRSEVGVQQEKNNTSALTWFIRYIYYWNLQFLNDVNNNKN
jgi:hypothetical protein